MKYQMDFKVQVYKNSMIYRYFTQRKAGTAKIHKNFFLLFFLTTAMILPGQLSASNPFRLKPPDYFTIVKNYADAMVSKGRDTYGSIHSPLFASALDREKMQPGTKENFGSIPDVRENDRSLGGANTLEDLALYEILYKLTEISGDKIYADEADKALKYFYTRCQSPNTGLMCWGEHLHWDFFKEECGFTAKNDLHEAAAWPFMDKWYELAPETAWKFAIGEWDHQISDKTRGDFSRHARWSAHGPQKGSDFPRYAGQMIERWADAYAREANKNLERRNEMITAITLMVKRMEENMAETATGFLPALRGADYLWPLSNIELARCLLEAAPKVPADLAKRMTTLAIKQDINFLKAPHLVETLGGFAVTLHTETGEPRDRSMNKPYTTTWSTGYGYGTHAGTANICYNRYLKLLDSHPELASRYKELMLAAAGQYLTTVPDTGILQKPSAYSGVIELMINSYELTRDKRFLERADFFAQIGKQLFLNDGFPLPKATNEHKHYESITGGPDFMLALLKLHVAMRVE